MTTKFSEPQSGPSAIEIGHLKRKYGDLRIADPARQGRLTASIFEHGQRTPVVVVPDGPDGYVLIDGYARVAALERLARDLVEALIWPLSETQGLVLNLRLEGSRQRSALEEGWLLAELVEVHGQTPLGLALSLERSFSWVSRRLALVRVVPESAQEAIRRGQIPAQAAMKSLVPLARAKPEHCERLVLNLEGRPISVRQMQALHEGWKDGDAEQRERIVEHPWLYLKAKNEVLGDMPVPEPSDAVRLEGIMESLVSLARQARRWIRHGAWRHARSRQQRLIEASRRELDPILAEIDRLIEEESAHARPRHPDDDPSVAAAGPRDPSHRSGPPDLEELGQGDPPEGQCHGSWSATRGLLDPSSRADP
jgi:ParB/RepB/Spo0J family partition protein